MWETVMKPNFNTVSFKADYYIYIKIVVLETILIVSKVCFIIKTKL